YLSGGSGFAGVYRELVSPMWNIFGYQAEAYAGGDEAGATGGLRALVGSRGIFLHAGVDYDIRDNCPDFILSFAPNIFRGGMFYTGGWFRLDWLPWRDNSFNLGWAMPIGVPHAGKTRSRKTTVALPKGSNPHPERTAPDPEIDRAL